MYAKYAYNVGATISDIGSDVVSLLTGETNKANLSAACDQANTNIYTTYNVAGWTMHDASAGASTVVLKASCDGDPTQFKYLKIRYDLAPYLNFHLYEQWNEITHVGTFPAGTVAENTDTQGGTVVVDTSTNPGEIYLHANQHIVHVYSRSFYNGSWRADSAMPVVEVTRDQDLFSIGSGYLPAGSLSRVGFNFSTVGGGSTNYVVSSSSTLVFPRVKDEGGVDSTTGDNALGSFLGQICLSNNVLSLTTSITAWQSYYRTNCVKVSASGTVLPILQSGKIYDTHVFGDPCVLTGLRAISYMFSTPTTTDEISIDGTDYVLYPPGGNTSNQGLAINLGLMYHLSNFTSSLQFAAYLLPKG